MQPALKFPHALAAPRSACYSLLLTLADVKFDKRTKYRLILRDSETDIEQSSIEVTIDRAFSDDF